MAGGTRRGCRQSAWWRRWPRTPNASNGRCCINVNPGSPTCSRRAIWPLGCRGHRVCENPGIVLCAAPSFTSRQGVWPGFGWRWETPPPPMTPIAAQGIYKALLNGLQAAAMIADYPGGARLGRRRLSRSHRRSLRGLSQESKLLLPSRATLGVGALLAPTPKADHGSVT